MLRLEKYDLFNTSIRKVSFVRTIIYTNDYIFNYITLFIHTSHRKNDFDRIINKHYHLATAVSSNILCVSKTVEPEDSSLNGLEKPKWAGKCAVHWRCM